MLVRFLSYAASMIGARRYKPLLITCLALIFSITGITIVASAFSAKSPDAASHAGQDQGSKATDKQQSTSLNGLEKKTPKEDKPVVQPSTNQNTNASGDGSGTAATNSNSGTNLEISLNTSTVSLSQASPNAAVSVSANVNGNTAIQWSITADSAVNGLNARIENVRDANGNAVVRLSNDSAAPGTYQFTITAKDALRSTSASKVITVTIN